MSRFLSSNWPFGAPYPEIYYDPRTVESGSTVNLHAKCVVVDESVTLIGSANFTQNAHRNNIEVGVLIEDAALAQQLVGHWNALIGEKLIVKSLISPA